MLGRGTRGWLWGHSEPRLVEICVGISGARDETFWLGESFVFSSTSLLFLASRLLYNFFLSHTVFVLFHSGVFLHFLRVLLNIIHSLSSPFLRKRQESSVCAQNEIGLKVRSGKWTRPKFGDPRLPPSSFRIREKKLFRSFFVPLQRTLLFFHSSSRVGGGSFSI